MHNPSLIVFLFIEATFLVLSYLVISTQDSLNVSAIHWDEIFHEVCCFFMTGCFLLKPGMVGNFF